MVIFLLTFIHSRTIGMETDPIRIQSIEISPDPPLPGKPLTVKVTGTASEVIEVGPSGSHPYRILPLFEGGRYCRRDSEVGAY